MATTTHDALVIGAGQSGLAAAYHLQRRRRSFLLMEAQTRPGGSWPNYYHSLRLFSAARYCALPGRPFSGPADHYPTAGEIAEYLRDYARHFDFPVRTGAAVAAIRRDAEAFVARAADGAEFRARSVVVATGSFRTPCRPAWPGESLFRGRILHASDYRAPAEFSGRRVVVVGGGNSGVQIAVELAAHARVTLAVRQAVRFLPHQFFGRDLHFWLRVCGLEFIPWLGGGRAPVIDSGGYRAALAAGRPPSRRPFTAFTPEGVVWDDGVAEPVDAVICATGYHEEYPFLSALPGAEQHRRGASTGAPGIFFVGREGQNGLASATLRGAGRDAARIVREICRRG